MLTEWDVRKLLQDECEKAGSQKTWAKRHKLTGAYVSDVLSDRRQPGAAILAALKLQRVVLYKSLNK